jgi:hypothetical protein
MYRTPTDLALFQFLLHEVTTFLLLLIVRSSLTDMSTTRTTLRLRSGTSGSGISALSILR